MKRPDWYLSTVRRLYQYPLDKKRLELLQVKLETTQPTTTASYSLAPGSSGVSDQTGKIGSNRAEVSQEIEELKGKIKEIDIALSSFKFESKKIIEMRYFEDGNTDSLVYGEMNMPQATYFRLRDRIIQKIASILGYYSEQQLDIEKIMRGK